MRLVVDCRYTRVDGRHDGISRYTAGIVTALGQLHPLTMLISDPRQLGLLPPLPWERVSKPTSIRELLIARQVNLLQPDVVFSPMQTMGSWGRRYRLVLTVHDLIYYRHRTPPREFSWPIRLLWRAYHLAWWPQRRLLNRADAVATVSETTKELLAAHRLTHRQVTVVANAADPVGGPAQHLTALRQRSRRLIYMGSFLAYKNVETLVSAMRLLPDYELVLLSPVSALDRGRLLALAGTGRVRFCNGVTEEQYSAALLDCVALVSASLDEGFGIPLVEAMSVGTPVIVSDIPIFREIGGAAAEYFPARDAAAFAAAVRRMEEEQLWLTRSTAGVEHAAQFSWHASAQTLLHLLHRVAEG